MIDVGKAMHAIDNALDALDGVKQGTMDTSNFLGEDCTSVAELAAMNHKSELSAAVFAIEHKSEVTYELYESAVHFVKQLSPGPESNSDGVCIVFTFPRAERNQLAVPGGEDSDDLHITLGYFGSPSNTITLDSMKRVAMVIATEYDEFTVNLNGITRFSAEGDGFDPIVVNADAPILPEMYMRMRHACQALQVNYEPTHGYSPHMTIGYLPYGEVHGFDRWTPIKVNVDSVELWYGKARYNYPLSGDYTALINAPEAAEDLSTPPYVGGAEVRADGAKDVFRGNGQGGVPNRGKRRKELIERCRKIGKKS